MNTCHNHNNLFENQDQELKETNVGAIRSAGLPIVWVLGYENKDFENKSGTMMVDVADD